MGEFALSEQLSWPLSPRSWPCTPGLLFVLENTFAKVSLLLLIDLALHSNSGRERSSFPAVLPACLEMGQRLKGVSAHPYLLLLPLLNLVPPPYLPCLPITGIPQHQLHNGLSSISLTQFQPFITACSHINSWSINIVINLCISGSRDFGLCSYMLKQPICLP